jgi:hypothetical protein
LKTGYNAKGAKGFLGPLSLVHIGQSLDGCIQNKKDKNGNNHKGADGKTSHDQAIKFFDIILLFQESIS